VQRQNDSNTNHLAFVTVDFYESTKLIAAGGGAISKRHSKVAIHVTCIGKPVPSGTSLE
jgi:hypothetical protein